MDTGEPASNFFGYFMKNHDSQSSSFEIYSWTYTYDITDNHMVVHGNAFTNLMYTINT